MGDGEYRRLKLGSEELDWQALEAHFRRSQNALRKKYWMLSKAPMPGTMEATPKQRAERKNWTEEETAELKRLVAAQSGADGESVDWEKLAAHFGTSVQTVKRKHRHAQEHLSLASGTPASTEKGAWRLCRAFLLGEPGCCRVPEGTGVRMRSCVPGRCFDGGEACLPGAHVVDQPPPLRGAVVLCRQPPMSVLAVFGALQPCLTLRHPGPSPALPQNPPLQQASASTTARMCRTDG